MNWLITQSLRFLCQPPPSPKVITFSSFMSLIRNFFGTASVLKMTDLAAGIA